MSHCKKLPSHTLRQYQANLQLLYIKSYWWNAIWWARDSARPLNVPLNTSVVLKGYALCLRRVCPLRLLLKLLLIKCNSPYTRIVIYPYDAIKGRTKEILRVSFPWQRDPHVSRRCIHRVHHPPWKTQSLLRLIYRFHQRWHHKSKIWNKNFVGHINNYLWITCFICLWFFNQVSLHDLGWVGEGFAVQ